MGLETVGKIIVSAIDFLVMSRILLQTIKKTGKILMSDYFLLRKIVKGIVVF